MELSIKTKGQGADDQEISIKLPVETLKMLQDSLVQPKNPTTSPASMHGSYRREASPMRGGVGSMNHPHERYAAYSPMRSFGDKASSSFSGSNFRPSNREFTPKTDSFEDDDDAKERRHQEIQSIIDRKVFTPKFWDVEGPAVISDFGPKPGMTQDPFLRSVSFQGNHFGAPHSTSPLNLAKNPPGKGGLSESGAEGPQPLSSRSAFHQQTFSDSLRSQYGGNLPTFGRALDDTLEKFDQDMQKIFKKAKHMKIETEAGPDRQLRVVMTPKNDEDIGDTFGGKSCEDRDSAAGSFVDPRSRRSSSIFNRKEEAAHIHNSKPRKAYDDDITETKKSAEKFLNRLLSGPSSGYTSQAQAQADDSQKPSQAAAVDSKLSQIDSDILGKKISSDHEEDPDEVSHNLDSASESSSLPFKGKKDNSPTGLSHKLETRMDTSAHKRSNKIADFQPLNFQQKTIEAYLTGTDEPPTRPSKPDFLRGARHSPALDPLLPARPRDGFELDLPHRLVGRDASDLAPEVREFGPLDSKRSALNREPESRGFPDTVSPIKPMRFGSHPDDPHERFAHLHLDISAVNNESMDELSHLTEAGLDTPVMKALSSIQGKIEELNNMMGRKTDTERLLEPQPPHDSSREEKTAHCFAPPGEHFLHSDLKMPRWALPREQQSHLDHSRVSINIHDSDLKIDVSASNHKENLSPHRRLSPSPADRPPLDPSRHLLDQLKISRELMENRRRRAEKSGASAEGLDVSS